MNISYILLAHKDPKQIKRLIDTIKSTGDFYIHIDKKTDIIPFVEELKTYRNVFFTTKRYSVWWAGFSMIKGYMQGLIDAYNSSKKYDRFVLMTGQDYPLMTNSEIVNEFSKNRDIEYVMAYNITTSTIPTDKDKILRKWFFDSFTKNQFLDRCYKSFMYRVITKNFTKKELSVPLNNKMVILFLITIWVVLYEI